MLLFVLAVLAFPALISATFCDDLPAIQAKIAGLQPETALANVGFPPVTPANRDAYLAWLRSVYLWNPTDAQLTAIAEAITTRLEPVVTALNGPDAATYKDQALTCLGELKTTATEGFDLALAAMNLKLDQARADFEQAKANLESNFTAFNTALDANCNEIVAFQSYILGFVSRFGQKILDFGAYITVVTARTAEASVDLIDAASAWIEDPNNATVNGTFTDAVKEAIQAVHEAERVVALLVILGERQTEIKDKLTADLLALQNRARSFQNRLAAFKTQFTVANSQLTDAQKAAIVEYFRSNTEFHVDLDSIRVTLTSDNNNEFTLTVTVSADGTGTVSAKLEEFEKSIKRWLIVEWGFHCADTETSQAKRSVQAADSLTVVFVGSPGPGGSSASAVLCSLLVLVIAFLFH